MSTCGACGRAFGPMDPSLAANDKQYHVECFKCTQCNGSLSGGYFTSGIKFSCQACFKRATASKCEKCEQPLAEFVEAMGLKYHPNCFTCVTCDVDLGDGCYFPHLHLKKPACRDCFKPKIAAPPPPQLRQREDYMKPLFLAFSGAVRLFNDAVCSSEASDLVNRLTAVLQAVRQLCYGIGDHAYSNEVHVAASELVIVVKGIVKKGDDAVAGEFTRAREAALQLVAAIVPQVQESKRSRAEGRRGTENAASRSPRPPRRPQSPRASENENVKEVAAGEAPASPASSGPAAGAPEGAGGAAGPASAVNNEMPPHSTEQAGAGAAGDVEAEAQTTRDTAVEAKEILVPPVILPPPPLATIGRRAKVPTQDVMYALYNHTKTNPDELSLVRGDRITVVQRTVAAGDGWAVGEVNRGGISVGLFPISYAQSEIEKLTMDVAEQQTVLLALKQMVGAALPPAQIEGIKRDIADTEAKKAALQNLAALKLAMDGQEPSADVDSMSDLVDHQTLIVEAAQEVVGAFRGNSSMVLGEDCEKLYLSALQQCLREVQADAEPSCPECGAMVDPDEAVCTICATPLSKAAGASVSGSRTALSVFDLLCEDLGLENAVEDDDDGGMELTDAENIELAAFMDTITATNSARQCNSCEKDAKLGCQGCMVLFCPPCYAKAHPAPRDPAHKATRMETLGAKTSPPSRAMSRSRSAEFHKEAINFKRQSSAVSRMSLADASAAEMLSELLAGTLPDEGSSEALSKHQSDVEDVLGDILL